MFPSMKSILRSAGGPARSFARSFDRSITVKASPKKVASSAVKLAGNAPAPVTKRFNHTDRPIIDADTVVLLEHLISQSSRMTAELNILLLKLRGRSINIDTFGDAKSAQKKKSETVYNTFYKYYFPLFTKENPQLLAQDVTKIVAENWKNLSKEEKNNWVTPLE